MNEQDGRASSCVAEVNVDVGQCHSLIEPVIKWYQLRGGKPQQDRQKQQLERCHRKHPMSPNFSECDRPLSRI